MIRMNMSRATAALAALAMIGCDEPLKNAQEIEEPRVLAVQIGGPEGTATPAPGEDARVGFLLAGPDGPQEARIAYQICEAEDSARGVPFCQGELYGEGEIARGASFATADFTVPDGAREGTRIAVLAVACVQGAPSLAEDPMDWSCSGGGAPLNLSFDGFVGGQERNDNPDLTELTVVIDGEEAQLDDADTEPHCGAGAPIVASDEKHEVVLVLSEDAREEEEWLQVSHFSTAGEYERQFSVIEPGEETDIELQWEASTSGGSSKHYVVVRDGWGGVAFATWSVCAE